MRESYSYLLLLRVLTRSLKYIVANAPDQVAFRAFLWLEFVRAHTYGLNKRNALRHVTAPAEVFRGAISEVVRDVGARNWEKALESIEHAAELGPLPVFPAMGDDPPHAASLPVRGSAKAIQGDAFMAAATDLAGNPNNPEEFDPPFEPLSRKYRELRDRLRATPPPLPSEVSRDRTEKRS